MPKNAEKINAPVSALDYLRTRPRWLVWRLETVPGRPKPTKPPYSAKTLHKCSITDPDNLVGYEEALAVAKRHGFSGVGYSLAPDDDLTGIDLDNCRNAATGEIAPWAREILDHAETYAEVSPSGKGIRFFALGKVERSINEHAAGVEIYGGGRYLTFTGKRIDGAPDEIRPAPKTLRALYARVESLRPKNPEKKAAQDNAPVAQPREKGTNFFRNVNDLAMMHPDAWVPELFPTAVYQSGTKAYRVSSADLGREYEEDLSIAPEGIVDFGLHDMGDPREGKRTPIDCVMFYAEEGFFEGKGKGEITAADAALWLCEQLGMDPAILGWRDREEFDPNVFDDGREFGSSPKADGAVQVSEKWEKPFDLWERHIVPDFPSDVMPDGVARFVDKCADNIGCDPNGLAVCALSACSGAIDHGSSVKLKRNGKFLAGPRIWALLVGDPSVKKSPMMRAALAPLRDRDGELYEIYQMFGDDDSRPTRLIAGDTTIEALGGLLAQQTRGILIYRDEFAGWIGSMEKYAGGGRGGAADRGFWLQAYDGGPYSMDRVVRGFVRIKNLSVSLLGGIQPNRLAEIHGLTSDGLLQRFVAVMLAASRFGEDKPLGDAEDSYDSLIRELVDLPPSRLTMTDDAIEAMTDLHRWLHNLEQETHGVYAGFQGFVGKLAGLAGSLALILHLAENPKRNGALQIEQHTVEKVTRLVRGFFVPHGFEFYRTAEATTDGDRLIRIASWLLTSKADRIVSSDLTRNVAIFRGKKVTEVADMVSPMVAGGWLRPLGEGPRVRSWQVNPRIHSLFEKRAAEEEQRKAALAEVMNARRRQNEP